MYQPIFMVLIYPGSFAHVKGCCPNSNLQAQSADAVSNVPHATGELGGIGRRIFTARIFVTQVDMKIIVAERLQVLGQPLSVGERSALGDLCVEGRPAPPSKHVVCAHATVMQLSNRRAIVIKL